MATRTALLKTEAKDLTARRGKVRDLYDLGQQLLVISTDRISAFDWVLPGGIPDKGRVLTQLSNFWFQYLGEPNHLVETDVAKMPVPAGLDAKELAGRTMLVRKAEVVPIECVVRGYLSGSGWKEYKQSGSVCGVRLPSGLQECEALPEPIFTPATKEESGHDINITFEEMIDRVSEPVARELRERSIAVYRKASEHARQRGIIIADTKFEWGQVADGLILIDEVLTPDSSRFWSTDTYKAGCTQESFDKQPVRDWLEQSGWDKNSPPPDLPEKIVDQTRARYIQVFEKLSGRSFEWK